MTAFRFAISEIDDTEVITTKGFIVAENYVKAMEKVVKMTTTPNGDNNLIDVYLMEVENADGVLFDFDIKELINDKN